MSLLKGAATFLRFHATGKELAKAKKELGRSLKLRAFEPLEPGGEAERAQGFVEFGHKDRSGFAGSALYEGEFALFSYRIDEVRIPTAAIRSELEAWEARFAEEEKRAPSRKEKSDAKEEIRHTLKSRYPISSKLFDVTWEQEGDAVNIWSGSRKVVDEIQAALEQAVPIKLVPLAPVTAAQELSIPDQSLTPTPALTLPEGEAARG
jgi:DNA recombination-dependent growth factor C